MAKKRVHEIAKERGISSKEVLAVLQKAGLDVKASASSVDENDIAMAFNGGKAQPAERGDRGGPQPSQRPGLSQSQSQQPQQSAPQQPAPAEPSQPSQPERPQRPTRGAPAGPGSSGRRRRVVIDSQASRRPSGPAPQQQPPRPGPGRPPPPQPAAAPPRPWPPPPHPLGRARPDDPDRGGRGGRRQQGPVRRHRQGGRRVAGSRHARGDQEADGAR